MNAWYYSSKLIELMCLNSIVLNVLIQYVIIVYFCVRV